MNYLFKITKSNKDWIALPFLESSFNPNAVSKVNAVGAWQIMPFIAKKLLPYSNGIDGRYNLILSTFAASIILKQNMRITKSSEISIIAYNSGLRNFFKTRKKLNKQTFSYDEYLENSSSKNFGFASKNFLMEYFALQESLDTSEMIHLNINEPKIKFYISRCKTRPRKVIRLLSSYDNKVNFYNSHYLKKNKVLPPGQIYITSKDLSDRYYRKVKVKELRRKSPAEWRRGTRFKSCKII